MVHSDAYLAPLCAGMRSTRSRISGVWVQFASVHKSADKCGGNCKQGIEFHTYACNATIEQLGICMQRTGGGAAAAAAAGTHRICADAAMCRIYYQQKLSHAKVPSSKFMGGQLVYLATPTLSQKLGCGV